MQCDKNVVSGGQAACKAREEADKFAADSSVLVVTNDEVELDRDLANPCPPMLRLFLGDER